MKQTPDAFSQGSISLIYKLSIGPLTRFKPTELDLRMWWEYLFHVSERSVKVARARHDFRLPGLYHQAATVKVQGIGRRNVRQGDILYVRSDKHFPDLVEVEWIPAGRRNGHWFSLSMSEWNSIAIHMEIFKR